MAVYALIVAVEKYPVAADLAGELPGTNDAAKQFYGWLTRTKAVDPANIICCADSTKVDFSTHGTTRAEIINGTRALVAKAKDNAAEVYCFLAGHGFNYPRDELAQEDIFVASDFETMAVSGSACIKLGELMDMLVPAMGPGDHYYFFDACRTEVPHGRIRPTELGVIFARSQLGFPGRAALFSIVQGSAARTDSKFTTHVVDGLLGTGRAKTWINGDSEMAVSFDSLCRYVQSRVKDIEPSMKGQSERILFKLPGIPRQTCTMTVDGASAGEKFSYVIKLRNMTIEQNQFDGPVHQVTLDPGDYQILMEQQGAPLVRVDPPPETLVNLYDPAKVVFHKVPGDSERGGLVFSGMEATLAATHGDGKLDVLGAEGTIIRVRGIERSFELDERSVSLSTELAAGDYRVTLEERGHIVGEKTVSLQPGHTVAVDMLSTASSPLRDSILQHVAPQGGRAVDFSETLRGPTADQDLGLWLALLGASRILGRKKEFSKLDRVPLEYRFDDLPAGSSPLYVLAGIDGPLSDYAIGVGKRPKWARMQAVPTVPGLFESFRPGKPGPLLVTFQAQGATPITLSTHALPNRATLLILTTDRRRGPLNVYQCLLPIRNLMGELPWQVRDRLADSPLNVTRLLVQVQRLFAQNDSIRDVAELQDAWTDLIYGKWLDPIASIIAGADLLRRGVLNPQSPLAQYRDDLPVMIGNFRKYFGRIPDVEALAKLTGEAWTLPKAAPLLADSAAAFDQQEQRQLMPYPNDRRQFGTPWIMWADAVKPFAFP